MKIRNDVDYGLYELVANYPKVYEEEFNSMIYRVGEYLGFTSIDGETEIEDWDTPVIGKAVSNSCKPLLAHHTQVAETLGASLKRSAVFALPRRGITNQIRAARVLVTTGNVKHLYMVSTTIGSSAVHLDAYTTEVIDLTSPFAFFNGSTNMKAQLFISSI